LETGVPGVKPLQKVKKKPNLLGGIFKCAPFDISSSGVDFFDYFLQCAD
jgi:hypothetical protein